MEPHVTFLADYFLTAAPDEDGALPGRELTQWLLDELRSRGVEADGSPGQEDFGWYARYRAGAPRLFVVSLLPGDDDEPARWAGWFERDAGLLGSLAGRRRGVREEAACVVREVLESSPLVSDLRWTLPGTVIG